MRAMSGVGDMGSDTASDGVVQKGCPFCAIAHKQSSNETTLLYEDNNYVIIQDIRPAVDHHYLLITKKHIKNAKQMKTTEGIEMIKEMKTIGVQFMSSKGLTNETELRQLIVVMPNHLIPTL
ncbi:unnamed protein product, partial [Medioppia subpectinata]